MSRYCKSNLFYCIFYVEMRRKRFRRKIRKQLKMEEGIRKALRKTKRKFVFLIFGFLCRNWMWVNEDGDEKLAGLKNNNKSKPSLFAKSRKGI